MHTLVIKYFQSLRSKLAAPITDVPEILKQSYLPGLDGLRAISILLVLMGHGLIGTWWVDCFPGAIGVDIFFVISGFIITTLLLKEKVRSGHISLKLFYIRRSLRIFPVAYLYLFCLFILGFLFPLHTTLRMFLSAGLYIDNFPIPDGKNWQTSHFWSLAVEEQFYLFFPFILVKSVKWYTRLVVLILITLPFIVMAGRIDLSSHLLHKAILSLSFLLGYGTSSILFGSLTAILLFKGIIKAPVKPMYWLSLLVFLCAIGSHITGILSWNALIYIFPLLICCVIVLSLSKADAFARFLNHPYVIKIGVLSYSIYIWQELFTYRQPWHMPFNPAVSLLVNMLLLAGVSYLSYTFYEKRFLTLKKHFKST